jgi:transposase InsO family protein
LDLHTRKIVGWSMRETLHTEIALEALTMAIVRQRPAPGLIHHPYRAEPHRLAFARSGITPSMSRKRRLSGQRANGELLSQPQDRAGSPSDLWHPRRDVFQYIEGFYNSRRLRSALGYISPAFAKRMTA